MQHYVVCLVMDERREKVALVRKNRGPACVVHMWNGPGGKIEDGEPEDVAATREFVEEAGVWINQNLWRRIAVLHERDAVVHFLAAISDEVLNVRTVESEEIKLWWLSEVRDHVRVMPNVRWMLPMLHDLDLYSDLTPVRALRLVPGGPFVSPR